MSSWPIIGSSGLPPFVAELMSLHEVSGATAKAGPSLPAWRLPMIEILSAPAHVAAFRLSGTVTADDYDKVIATLEAKLAAGGSIGVYVDAPGLARKSVVLGKGVSVRECPGWD